MKEMMKSAVSKQKKQPTKNASAAQNLDTRDSKLVSNTLVECIQSGDHGRFQEVLTAFIMSTSKLQLSRKTGIGRQTLYDLIDPNKTFNPTLATISAIFRGLHE